MAFAVALFYAYLRGVRILKIEIRADNTAFISGYVNAVERESRPVITPRGRVNELIEPRAFAQALDRADNVDMTVDHTDKKIADTKDKSLMLCEDAIGLRAEATISDPETIEEARAGNIKGWSFGMRNVVDEIEERADKLPLRRIKGLELDHVTLVIHKTPCYSATSVEVRADGESDLETRCSDTETTVSEHKKQVDYTEYEKRIKNLEVR